jgi:hypothetical protein
VHTPYLCLPNSSIAATLYVQAQGLMTHAKAGDPAAPRPPYNTLMLSSCDVVPQPQPLSAAQPARRDQ